MSSETKKYVSIFKIKIKNFDLAFIVYFYFIQTNAIELQLRWPTLVRSIPGQKRIKGGTLCV
jgi:hypothetical protein